MMTRSRVRQTKDEWTNEQLMQHPVWISGCKLLAEKPKITICDECYAECVKGYNLCRDHLGRFLHKQCMGAIHRLIKSESRNTVIKYLGCNIHVLKVHLALKFEPWMSWDNYGVWEIDHIVPMNYNKDYVTLESTIERLHYTNLQPLCASQNRSKGNRYVGK